METELDSTWERSDRNSTPAMIRVIDHTRDADGVWWVRAALIGPTNHRWWMPETTLQRRYRRVVGSEAEAAAC